MDTKTNKLKPLYLKQVNTFVKTMESKGIHIDNLILFGSRVKGTEHKWSDLDTCVVSRSFGKDLHTERVKLMCLLDDSSLIEPHPFTPKEFADNNNPLIKEIKTNGIRVI